MKVLLMLISISTLATHWLTANLAGPTIRFIRHKRNELDMYYSTYVFQILLHCSVKVYNYAGPTICAKDQRLQN